MIKKTKPEEEVKKTLPFGLIKFLPPMAKTHNYICPWCKEECTREQYLEGGVECVYNQYTDSNQMFHTVCYMLGDGIA